MKIKQIQFSQLVDYWKDTEHFAHVPNKKYNEIIKYLGPFECKLENPKAISYGVFDGDKMIGGTQIQEWDETTVRFRTVNIREEYRGKNLGYWMIKRSILSDWFTYELVIEWMRDSIIRWCESNGFEDYEGGVWDTSEDIPHKMMCKKIERFKMEDSFDIIS